MYEMYVCVPCCTVLLHYVVGSLKPSFLVFMAMAFPLDIGFRIAGPLNSDCYSMPIKKCCAKDLVFLGAIQPPSQVLGVPITSKASVPCSFSKGSSGSRRLKRMYSSKLLTLVDGQYMGGFFRR